MKNFKTIASVIIFSLMLVPLVSFAAVGAQQGIHEPGTGIENPELKETGQGTGQALETQTKTMLQSQGDEDQSEVGVQQKVQAGQGMMNGNAQGNQVKNQVKIKTQTKAVNSQAPRKTRMANAVQTMMQLAERNQNAAGKLKAIAQAQELGQNKIEAEMAQVKNRGQLRKFFFGADYRNINSIEDRLANHEERLAQLKQLVVQLDNEDDASVLQEQITNMEQIKTELEKEVKSEKKGFSLFGWLNRMLVK